MATTAFPRIDRATMAKPSAAQRKQTELTVKKAKVQLALRHPFFATLLMKAKVTLDDSIPTACVNAAGHIRVGTGFATTITVPQMMFLLAHEVMHPALLHFSRRGARGARGWNVAGDKVINDVLTIAGLHTIPGGVYQTGASKFFAEELYQQDPEGNSADIGDSGYDPGNGLDDMYPSGMDEAQERQCEETWRVNVAQAKAVAKQRGAFSGDLERMVDAIINPITPWYELLERMMTSFVKFDYSWSRPNKRHIGTGLYLPSSGKSPRMGVMVIQSDESRSISANELEHFKGHISKIIEVCCPEKVIVLHTDTEVNEHVDEFTMDDLPLDFKVHGGGGTDMRAGVRWCIDNGVEPEVFITLTDMYTPFPKEDPGFPLIWLATTDKVAPIGETIRYVVE